MIRVVVLALALLAAPAAAAQEPRSIAELFGAANTQQMLMRMEVALARVQARRASSPPTPRRRSSAPPAWPW